VGSLTSHNPIWPPRPVTGDSFTYTLQKERVNATRCKASTLLWGQKFRTSSRDYGAVMFVSAWSQFRPSYSLVFVLNELSTTPRNLWGSGCIYACFLHFSRLTPGERAPGTHLIGGRVGPRRYGRYGEVKILDHTGTRTTTPRFCSP
jgi:hypothetical protein